MATPYRVPSISDIAYTRSRTPTSADITLNNLISFIESSQQLDQQKFTMQREEERYADRVEREEERFQQVETTRQNERTQDKLLASRNRQEDQDLAEKTQLDAESRDIWDRVSNLKKNNDFNAVYRILDSKYAQERLTTDDINSIRTETATSETKYNNKRDGNSEINKFIISPTRDWSTLDSEEYQKHILHASQDTLDSLFTAKKQDADEVYRTDVNKREDEKQKLEKSKMVLTALNDEINNMSLTQRNRELTPEEKKEYGYGPGDTITVEQHFSRFRGNIIRDVLSSTYEPTPSGFVGQPKMKTIGGKEVSEFAGAGNYDMGTREGHEAYLLDFMRNEVNDPSLKSGNPVIQGLFTKFYNGEITITTDNDGNPVGVIKTSGSPLVDKNTNPNINNGGGVITPIKVLTDPALTGEALKERLDKDMSLAISSGSVNAGFTVRHEASYNDDLIEAGQTPISNKKSRDVRNHASNEYQTREGWGTTSFIFNKMNTAFEAQQKSTSVNRKSEKARFDTTLEWGIDRLKNSLPTIKKIIAEIPENNPEKLEWRKLQARTVNQVAKIDFLSDETRKDYEESDLYNRRGLLDLSSNESFFQFISKYYGTRKSARTSTGQTDVMGRIQAADYTKYIHDTDILDISKFSPRVSGERMNPMIVEDAFSNLAKDVGNRVDE